MSGRIELAVVALPPRPPLERFLPKAQMTRVVAEVESRDRNRELIYDLAIVDSGAPFCLIPQRIWERCRVEVLGDYSVQGIANKPECVVPVKVGRITLRLLSRGRLVKSLRVTALLAESNDVPLLLGFHDVLSRFALYMNQRARRAYLTVHPRGG